MKQRIQLWKKIDVNKSNAIQLFIFLKEYDKVAPPYQARRRLLME